MSPQKTGTRESLSGGRKKDYGREKNNALADPFQTVKERHV